jgi:hypothetical protein
MTATWATSKNDDGDCSFFEHSANKCNPNPLHMQANTKKIYPGIQPIMTMILEMNRFQHNEMVDVTKIELLSHEKLAILLLKIIHLHLPIRENAFGKPNIPAPIIVHVKLK